MYIYNTWRVHSLGLQLNNSFQVMEFTDLVFDQSYKSYVINPNSLSQFIQ